MSDGAIGDPRRGAARTESASNAGLRVHIQAGDLEGHPTSEEHVVAFKGVPYAQPPIGGLRWKPPLPVTSWTGTRSAAEDGPACMQPNSGPNAFYTDIVPMSEDCLTLNVWVPAKAQNAPVMVFFHGGGFVTGYGGSPRYDGAKLARRGAIVVTVNYRLGVFGFLCHPELSAESPRRSSGNYGLLDQIAALHWVRENISAFGGDPKLVTIFGQSAGGISVALLMTSPLASGLFQQAVMMSAPLWPYPEIRSRCLDFPPAEEAGLKFGCDHGAPTLAELRAMPADVLLTASTDNPLRRSRLLCPIVDGWVQTEQVYEAFEAGRQAKVPLIAGFASGEMTSLDPGPYSTDAVQYEARVRAGHGALADKFLERYPSSSIQHSSVDAATDAYFGWPTERLLQLHEEAGQPAWLYCFDHTYPSEEQLGLGAFHSSDVPFVFGNVGPGAFAPKNWPAPPSRAEDLAMSEIVMDYLTAFAREGCPAPSNQPPWPAFTGVDGGYLAFRNSQAIAAGDVMRGMYEVHDAQISRLRESGRSWHWSNTGAWAPAMDSLK